MNANGTSTDVFAILAVAQANWPHDPVAGSEAVWRKWAEPLRRYCFEEVAAALDSLARTHPRFPSLAELLSELRGRRGATACIAGDPSNSECQRRTWPRVPLEVGYVIGPYSLAFARMNSEGWTVERLIACIRVASHLADCAAGPEVLEAGQQLTGRLPREPRGRRLDPILAEMREAVAETVAQPAPVEEGRS